MYKSFKLLVTARRALLSFIKLEENLNPVEYSEFIILIQCLNSAAI